MTQESPIYMFSMVFPWLAVTWAVSLLLWPRPGVTTGTRANSVLPGRIWLPMATLVISLLPLRGLALVRWVVGCNANFSIPLTLWVGLSLLERLLGRRLLGTSEAIGCWGFGLTVGLLLYPMALGLTAFDPYSLGWQPRWLLTVTLILTFALLVAGNRFGIWIMVALLAYNLRMLESPNFWDYLVDPIYFIASLVMAIMLTVERLRAWLGRGPSPSAVNSVSEK
jgi:hypothetical protein